MGWVPKFFWRLLQPSGAAYLEAIPGLFSSAFSGASCAIADSTGPSLIKKIRDAQSEKFWGNSSQVTSCYGCRKNFGDDLNHQILLFLKRDPAYFQELFQARLVLPPTRLDLRWLKRLRLRMIYDFVEIRPEWLIFASKSSKPPKRAAPSQWTFSTQ